MNQPENERDLLAETARLVIQKAMEAEDRAYMELLDQPADTLIKSIVQENLPPRPVDLTATQEALIKRINLEDFSRLLNMMKAGITDPCLLREYIPGEAAPLPDPEGTCRTFISTYGIGCYVRAFLTRTGVVGLSLDTVADTSAPGMRDLVVETKASFDPHAYARFVQASITRHSLKSSAGKVRFAQPV
jgi:hypothetical protein